MNTSDLPQWVKSSPDPISKNEVAIDFVYNLMEPEEINLRLNKWFCLDLMYNIYKQIVYDSIVTIKKDKDSYSRIDITIVPYYNPIDGTRNYNKNSMRIGISTEFIKTQEIWFAKKLKSNTFKIRDKIIDYISLKEEVDGEELVKYCISLGADKNYNIPK
jgi:hypothetical protein